MTSSYDITQAIWRMRSLVAACLPLSSTKFHNFLNQDYRWKITMLNIHFEEQPPGGPSTRGEGEVHGGIQPTGNKYELALVLNSTVAIPGHIYSHAHTTTHLYAKASFKI